ncbi:ATP synthase subunit C [Algihabitans sp.]|uniref:ATP synthase subunit C n=1 Tax=Algihabitans sp. TaxID=2821514 RepID=UPI003BA9E81D
MNEFVLALGWSGIYAPMAIGAIGSAIGCGIAGQAGIGAMLETDGGYGRYIGISAFPSTFVIYGIVVMFTLDRAVTPENAGGLFGIGVFAAAAFLYCGIWQGRACASAINAAKEKPEIFGLSLAPAAIIEGFAVFAFVFALVISAGIPGAGPGAVQ